MTVQDAVLDRHIVAGLYLLNYNFNHTGLISTYTCVIILESTKVAEDYGR